MLGHVYNGKKSGKNDNMPKKVKGLTAAKVKRISKPYARKIQSITKSGDYADGNGLYL